ncbi:nitrite reductase [Arthrobacter sp. YC-RL1]|uniref:molybdopterin oxidoreductase family protein n=1 Tax=Arthrobacter sp. YC-RL1 TaxID=1652545 RepID=UPI00063D90C1|nr:molybdopterin oxidoreductase family protein [Arthrobacter sp. YC-RL1]ALQ29646.1 nitrite reductase [Arthrobacter sp. YC-RL1]KLI88992.1 nitrite reductase [Arthrobacter sp. YC-RL1]
MGVATHCPYCALQCGITLEPGTTPVGLKGRNFETNAGALCRKGYSAAQLLDHPERLNSPLERGADGVLHPVSWERALELVVHQVRAVQQVHGKDAVAVFGSGSLTNEKAYQLGKFARLALGTSRIDYNGRFCMSSAAAAGNKAFGLDRGLPFPLADLDRAGTIMLLGSNVADTMPPFVRHLESAREHGGLIVVDPRRSATAELADTHLQPAPGTDLQLLLGLAHVLLAEELADTEYLAARTWGLESLRISLATWWPERVQSLTGVPASVIRQTARALASAAQAAHAGGKPVYILTGRGVEQHANGTATVSAAINLALLLGLPGTLAGGFGTITGQGNGQGGREHGQKADQLPGYRKITDPAARRHVAGVWGVDPDIIPGPGIPAAQLLATLGEPGGARMLLMHGSNPVISSPNANRTAAALRRLDYLVVSDFFLSETAAQADLVLPVLQWAEEEGTMTNLEGRVLRRRAALAAPAGARSELWLLAELADRLQAPASFSADPREVFAELGRASAGGIADYSGVDYNSLDAGAAVYWPCPAGTPISQLPGERSGTPRLFLQRFARPDGKARLEPVYPQPAAGVHAGRKPGSISLVTGRLLEHYQSGAQTRRVAELHRAAPAALAVIHPDTALARGISDGQDVLLENTHGRVEARARLDAGIRLDTVFLPFHFPETQNANLLTGDAVDPDSSMPEFKHASVLLSRSERDE